MKGLVRECEAFLVDLGVVCEPTSLSKHQWRKLIREKVDQRNQKNLLDQIKTYKKLDYNQLAKEEYEAKPYLSNMTVPMARTYFALRTSMLKTVQMNYKHVPEYQANQWKCVCGQPDYQAHLETCSSYLHLQNGLNMQCDADIVKFYQLVIKERTENED